MRTAATLLVAALIGTDLIIYKGPPELRMPGTRAARPAAPARAAIQLDDLGPLPDFAGGTAWLNSAPLDRADLKGKVVVVDIWTFACSNCQAALPSVKALHAKYASRGAVVIGVHTPELKVEYERANVERAVAKLGVTYPVVLDNDYKIWNALGNRYWPSIYIVDRRGRIRYRHDGEGDYDQQDKVVQQLLAERAN
ncbi:MAG: redoxin family protein [Gemmatimonadetes bacterium]|nr:redoxin family protein [Gemmatimonadota bacterium]